MGSMWCGIVEFAGGQCCVVVGMLALGGGGIGCQVNGPQAGGGVLVAMENDGLLGVMDFDLVASEGGGETVVAKLPD